MAIGPGDSNLSAYRMLARPHDLGVHRLASKLAERGANHVPAANLSANVQVDGRLVTGQNPASATPLAETLVEILDAAGRPR